MFGMRECYTDTTGHRVRQGTKGARTRAKAITTGTEEGAGGGEAARSKRSHLEDENEDDEQDDEGDDEACAARFARSLRELIESPACSSQVRFCPVERLVCVVNQRRVQFELLGDTQRQGMLS